MQKKEYNNGSKDKWWEMSCGMNMSYIVSEEATLPRPSLIGEIPRGE